MNDTAKILIKYDTSKYFLSFFGVIYGTKKSHFGKCVYISQKETANETKMFH